MKIWQGFHELFNFMRGNILVLTVTMVLGMFCRSMVFPYASLYILELGGSPQHIGFINSLMPLAGLFVFPISGYLTDIGGRVKLIALAGYLSGLSLILYVFAPSWEWIALGGLIRGFMVFQFPPTSALMADSLAPERRGTGIATMNMVAASFAMLSPYLAGVMLDIYGNNRGMRILYGTLSIVYLINATINMLFLRDTGKETGKHAPRSSVSDLLRIFREVYSGVPTMWANLPNTVKALALVIVLGFSANAILSPFWVVYAIDNTGLSQVEWGTILLIETGLRTLLYIPAGILVDRYGRARSLLGSLLLSLGSIPLFVLSKGFMEVLLIRSAIAGINAFFIPACSALMADTVPRDLRGRVMAAMGRGTVMIGASGGGTGGPGVGYLITIPLILSSIAGGYIYALNPSYPWILVSVSILLSLLITALYIRDPKKSSHLINCECP